MKNGLFVNAWVIEFADFAIDAEQTAPFRVSMRLWVQYF
jgi:hypothetical protein